MPRHLPKPPLAGAGDIRQDARVRNPLGERQGISHDGEDTRVGQTRYVATKRLKPCLGAIDSHDGAPVSHPFSQMGGLAPRCRTQVQHRITGPWVEERSRKAGGGLLDVEEAEPVLQRLGQGEGGGFYLIDAVAHGQIGGWPHTKSLCFQAFQEGVRRHPPEPHAEGLRGRAGVGRLESSPLPFRNQGAVTPKVWMNQRSSTVVRWMPPLSLR